jgi:chitinase
MTVLLACLPLAAGATGASEPADAGRLRVIGYIADGERVPAVSAHKLDVINFAFAQVGEDHAIHLDSPTAAAALRALTALRTDNPRLQVLVSVGGWGGDHFSEAAASAEARAVFAASAAELVRRHDLDGIDLDWEYPTLPGPGISHSPADRVNFTAMLQAVRTQLDALGDTHGRRYLLTIAAADGEAADGMELARIAPLLDFINLMTYDFYNALSTSTGHHAALHGSAGGPREARTTARAVQEFLDAGVPAAKLNVGVAFYGRVFEGVARERNGLHQPFTSDGGFLTWRELLSTRIDSNGYRRHWDAAAQAPYLWNPGTASFISYEDPASLRAKAAYVRELGLGGLMYWEHRQDHDEQLLDVIRSALDEAPLPDAPVRTSR